MSNDEIRRRDGFRPDRPLVDALSANTRRMVPALVGLALLMLSACRSPDPVTGKPVTNFYTIDQDIELGRSTLRANTDAMKEADVRINDDPARVAQLKEMVRRLAAVADLSHLPYTVTLYHTNIVNAAAAPGGSMMVFEGLYDLEDGLVDPDDENELAAVMAHEMAHVNCRHVTERMTRVMPFQVGLGLASAILLHNDENELAAVAQGVFVVGAAVIIPKYSRQNESEADRVGLFYMARAGYDPRAAPELWKRASEKKGARDSTSIFATHPASKNRYKALEKLIPAAMDEYARATGRYPADYTPPPGHPRSRRPVP